MPPRPASTLLLSVGRLWFLPRGVDVQLTLQDVVDDRLTQVIHNMAVTVLQGQSDGRKHTCEDFLSHELYFLLLDTLLT